MSCRDNLHHKLNGSLLLLLGKNQSIESISRINQLIDQSKTHTHTRSGMITERFEHTYICAVYRISL